MLPHSLPWVSESTSARCCLRYFHLSPRPGYSMMEFSGCPYQPLTELSAINSQNNEISLRRIGIRCVMAQVRRKGRRCGDRTAGIAPKRLGESSLLPSPAQPQSPQPAEGPGLCGGAISAFAFSPGDWIRGDVYKDITEEHDMMH